MTESLAEAYDRGMVAGKIAIRLDHHDVQLVAMNDVLAKVVNVEADLTLAVQELAGEAKASRETAVALATALKDAKETAEGTARNESLKAAATERESAARAALGWSPVTRVFAIVAALAIVFNLYQGLTGG